MVEQACMHACSLPLAVRRNSTLKPLPIAVLNLTPLSRTRLSPPILSYNLCLMDDSLLCRYTWLLVDMSLLFRIVKKCYLNSMLFRQRCIS